MLAMTPGEYSGGRWRLDLAVGRRISEPMRAAVVSIRVARADPRSRVLPFGELARFGVGEAARFLGFTNPRRWAGAPWLQQTRFGLTSENSRSSVFRQPQTTKTECNVCAFERPCFLFKVDSRETLT